MGNKGDAIDLLEANYEAVREQMVAGGKGVEEAATLDVIALGYMAIGDFKMVESVLNKWTKRRCNQNWVCWCCRRQAVDISPLRRVNQAIFLLTTGARESAFRNVKTIAECLVCVAVMLLRRRTRLNKLPRQIVEEGLWYLFLVVYLGFCEEHL
ncbi:tetratricopeptide repeat (TPR)-like superfamily protein [Artemisia annua]|uniref:Tetratricopeptide repeat (TPR)-like superfamily protein n=1 Tax=Artemisia annua TaxID=35608 RepID=A0A2U1Q5X0_ARTAN|nr:tetratricopeptide repeat (TPR)-like superfamily protein [Artemisia annua]